MKLKLNDWVINRHGHIGFVIAIGSKMIHVQYQTNESNWYPVDSLQIVELTFKGWVEQARRETIMKVNTLKE